MPDKKYKQIFVQGPINASFIADSIKKHSSNTNIGAHNIFLGQVRSDEVNGKPVVAIEYTAYEEMSLEKMYEIREAIFEKYKLTCMHIYHSLGLVSAGEISMFVFTSAKHRKEAVDACRDVVELIKLELPIWGKEILKDSSYQWKENN